MPLLLAAMAEGGDCAVMVGAGVIVGVVAATMAEGEGGGSSSSQKKKREKNYHNTVQFIILSYVISKKI